MLNAGKYKHQISIIKLTKDEDEDGFKETVESLVLKTRAAIKTTKGFTVIKSGSDFESTYTNFTIRFPKTEIQRDMFVKFKGKLYSIDYLNNIDEADVELEIQAKAVTK